MPPSSDHARTGAELAERLTGPGGSATVWHDEARAVDRSVLARLVDRCSEVLVAAGVCADDPVAVQLPPTGTGAATLLAAWSLGAKPMLLDHRFTERETRRMLDRCPARFLVWTDSAPPATFTEEVRLVVEPVEARPGSSVPDAVCLVQFTSGSTGLPKVIGRSAASISKELERYARTDGMPTAEDRLLLLCSPTHTWGLIGGILHGLAAEVPVLFPKAPHGLAAARAAATLGATVAFGVPMQFEMLAGLSDPPELPTLRAVASAGAMIGGAVADRFESAFGCRLGHVYGLTETGVVCADIPGRLDPPSVGLPTADMEVRLLDGELLVRLDASPYIVDDGVDRFADGWLRTFDRASIDPSTGAVSIHGRADSVVSVGGIKVDLMEVEQAVADHPAVSAAVVTFGDVIEAHVATEREIEVEELVMWCRERLSSLKVPKRFYVARDLLRTPSGKIVRDRVQLVETHAMRATRVPAT